MRGGYSSTKGWGRGCWYEMECDKRWGVGGRGRGKFPRPVVEGGE